jgi:hypothetical protein
VIVDREPRAQSLVLDETVAVERDDVRVALRVRPPDERAPAHVDGARVAEVRPGAGADRTSGAGVPRQREKDEEEGRDA